MTDKSDWKQKIGNWFTIKRLLYIYILFIILLIGAILTLNHLNRHYIENILISNSEAQLNLMNNALQDDLSTAQLTLMNSMNDIAFTRLGVSTDDDAGTNEATLKKKLNDTLNYIGLFSSIDIYIQDTNKIITTRLDDGTEPPDLSSFYKNITVPGWYQIPNMGLYYLELYPIRSDREKASFDYLIAGRIRNDFFSRFMSSYSSDPNIKTLFFFLDEKTASTNTTNKLEQKIAKQIRTTDIHRNRIRRTTHEYNGKSYVALSVYNTRSDGILTAYYQQTLVENFYKPVSRYFTFVLIFLLVSAILVSIMFYSRIYKNINILIQNIRLIEKGDLTTRFSNTDNSSEFDYVFQNFNQMMNTIQSLMTTTHQEIRLREQAELRQLQSQINPHFLYNNLFFIMSMVRTSPDEVVSMTENLAEYYRYTTKNYERVELSDELNFCESYLKIMSLRKKISYSINVPLDVMALEVPPLIIQPLVENTIYHGIEGRRGASRVTINGSISHDSLLLSVTDDGKGLTDDEILKLKKRLSQTHRENSQSVGLWNVQKRLINLYGTKSQLQFTKRTPGLTISFIIPINNSNGGYPK